jgi:hypothetical protein
MRIEAGDTIGLSGGERDQIIGLTLEAIKEADGVVLMPEEPKDGGYTYGWHEINDNCYPRPDPVYINILRDDQ